MTDTLYIVIRQILMGLLIFLGGHMLFVTLPPKVKNSSYRLSQRLMGAAFMIVPVSCFLYTQDNRLDITSYISTAINLTTYFATFVLMAIAFLILLGQRINRKTLLISAATVVLYPLPLWACIMSGNKELISSVTTISYSLFIVFIMLISAYILYYHHKVTKGGDSCLSGDVEISVRWISKSI